MSCLEIPIQISKYACLLFYFMHLYLANMSKCSEKPRGILDKVYFCKERKLSS